MLAKSGMLGVPGWGKRMQFDQLNRRTFITLLGGATALPLAAHAQQTGKPPTIGFLGLSTRSANAEWSAAFVQRLRDLGHIEGRTIKIEYRWAEGREERFAEIAAEFVRLKVDIIVTAGNPAVVSAEQGGKYHPTLFSGAGDPVGAGLVASLARPGGNVTGLSTLTPDLAAKRLEILREVVPDLRRLAILTNLGNRLAVLEMREVQAAASTFRLDVVTLEIQRGEDIPPVFEALKGRADALYVCLDALLLTNRIRINTFAPPARLPMMTAARDFVEVGGLVSYGPNFPELWRRAGDMSTRFFAGLSQPIYRSNSRPSSILPSISRPPGRSASKCRRRCSPAPTR